MGMGPMSGRGMGHCTGYYRPGYANAFCMGRGRGFRMNGSPGRARYEAYPYGFAPNAFQETAPVADEKEVLRRQAEFLEKQLKEVRDRLDNIGEAE